MPQATNPMYMTGQWGQQMAPGYAYQPVPAYPATYGYGYPMPGPQQPMMMQPQQPTYAPYPTAPTQVPIPRWTTEMKPKRYECIIQRLIA